MASLDTTRCPVCGLPQPLTGPDGWARHLLLDHPDSIHARRILEAIWEHAATLASRLQAVAASQPRHGAAYGGGGTVTPIGLAKGRAAGTRPHPTDGRNPR